MTAITEIQRSGAKAARGLVSIQSRYNQILDDTSSTGQKLIAFYDEHSIQLYDQEGQLRSLWETLSDVAEIWDTLDENEQKYFLNIQAGANQSVQLGALMGNFQTAIEATETALNSAGSAMRENESYMQSLNARTDLLKSTFQTLANDVIPKELIAKGLDVLDGALKILDTDLGVIITRFTMLTGMGWGLTSLVNASKILPTIIKQFSSFAKFLQTGVVKIPKAIAKVGGLTAAMAKLQAVSLPIIAILTALGVGIYAIVKASREKKQAVDELTQSIKAYDEAVENSNKTLQDNITETQKTVAIADQYVARLETLQKKTQLTKEEQEEYHAILSNLTTLIPQLSGIIDLQTDSIQGGTQAIREQIGAWKDLAIQQAYQQKMSGVYSAIAEISIEKQQRQSELEALLAEKGSLTSEGIALQQQYQLGVGNLQYATAPGFAQKLGGIQDSLIAGRTRIAEINRDIPTYTKAIDELNSKLSEAEQEAASMQEAVTALMSEMGLNTSTTNSQSSMGDLLKSGMSPKAFVVGLLKSGMSPDAVIAFLKERGVSDEEIVNLLGLKFPTGSNVVEETGTTTSNVISSIEEQIEEIVFNLQDFISLSQSEIDLLESEYSLMEAQGASSEELNAKIKEIQDAYHAEAEILRTILSRAEEYNLTQEEINDIQTEINNRSIDWWNWQNKINKLLKDAETSTENIEENVDDIYTRYEEGIAKLREEERERAANYKDDETYQYWNLQIQLIDEYIAELQKSNQQLNEQLKLQEKLDNLARAKESRLLVYKDGSYQYIEDVDAVSKAARELSDVQREQALAKTIEDLEYTKSAYQAMVGAVEEGMMGFPSWANTYLRKLDRQGGWQEVFGYAGGTTNASGGLSLVGEKGAELRILNKGDGILPSNLTENLMRWGQMTPNQFKSNSIGGFGNNMAVTIQALNLPNVSNGADFVNYIKNHMFGQVLNLVH